MSEKIRDLVDWLLDYMERNGLSASVLAKRMGYQSNGAISPLLRREKPIPLKNINRWVDALHLSDDERRHFVLLANLSLAPRFIQSHYWETVDKMAMLREAQAADRKTIQGLSARIGESKVKPQGAPRR